MRTLSLAIVVSLAVLACSLAGASVQGNGKTRTEARTVPAFTGLSVSGALEVEVTVGGAQSVELIGDDNILPLIRTRVTGGTLVVDSKQGYSTKTDIKVRITTPSLEALSASGACNGKVAGIRGKRFAADLSGASKFALSGAVDQASFELSGAGELTARGLTAATASASVSGAGSIELTATSTLAADVSGAATIDYWGKPGSVARDVSGAGEIRGH